MLDTITGKTYPAYPAPVYRPTKAQALAYLQAAKDYHLGQAERYADLAEDAQKQGIDFLVNDYLIDGQLALETALAILP